MTPFTSNTGNRLFLLLSTVLALGASVSARNLHATSSQAAVSACPCGFSINIFGMTVNACKACAQGDPGSDLPIPSSPPDAPPLSPAPPPTLYLVRVNNKCNEDIIVALMESQTLLNSFVRIPIGTGGIIGQSYLPIVLYGYGVSSKEDWQLQGDTCFQADSNFNKDPIVLKNEPGRRTVCGVTISKFDRVEYLPEAAYYQGEVDFTCEKPQPAPQWFFHYAWHFGKHGR